VRIEATAQDPEGQLARVEFLVGGNVVATVTAAPFEFNFETVNLTPGVYDVTARATDAAGASVTSNPLTLNVVSEIRVSSAAVRGDGSVEMRWASPSGASFVVEASGDLVTWTDAGTVTADVEGGRFAEPPGGVAKFYRVRPKR
jgi:hypothetical protein